MVTTLLASRRHADVRAAVHGDALRQAARVLQGRGRAARPLERARTRAKKLLQGLAEKGFGRDQLAEMQKIIDAEKSDLFDVLAHVAYALPPLTREERAAQRQGRTSARTSTPSSRSSSTSCCRTTCSVGVRGTRPGEADAAAPAQVPQLHRRRRGRPGQAGRDRQGLRRLPEVPVRGALSGVTEGITCTECARMAPPRRGPQSRLAGRARRDGEPTGVLLGVLAAGVREKRVVGFRGVRSWRRAGVGVVDEAGLSDEPGAGRAQRRPTGGIVVGPVVSQGRVAGAYAPRRARADTTGPGSF